jgi:hypothetical protein
MFVEMADTLTDDFDILELLTVLGEGCVELFESAESGVVLRDHDGELHLMVASTERVRLLELAALERHDGPSLRCVRGGRAIAATLDRAEEWGRFGRDAVRAGLHSVDAFPMRHGDAKIGSLDIFRIDPTPMPPLDVAVAQALADAATIAILLDQSARESQGLVAQLHTALNSRISIEQAKGALAERADIDTQEAFNRLRRYARDHNRKLTGVAKAFVEGTLPPEAVAALLAKRSPSRADSAPA